ncbi:hypothetical protein CRG98_030384 [Punica granatum]|uniref:RNase H type-1 domain-containing protein n=1 Tax=Punica granatum TaxID=22663 RepID=A0A2I0IZ23_PUNGR|nr:hypothetical protein CRG98_030384 [Punica granatum]
MPPCNLEFRRSILGSGKGIARAWNRVASEAAWAIRDGTKVRFLEDRWVRGCGPLIDDAARAVESTVRGRMICEFVTDAGTWYYSLMEGYHSHTKLLCIASHRPPARDQGEDSLYWTFEPTDNFSVKTAYCFLAQAGWAEEDHVWKSIWSWRGPQRGTNLPTHRPPSGWAKLNTDGASRGNPGLSGAGGIVRDADGFWLGGYVRNIDYASSIVVELWGVLEGLQYVWDLRLQRIILELDSEVVVRFIQSPTTANLQFDPLIEEFGSFSCENGKLRSVTPTGKATCAQTRWSGGVYTIP